MTCKQDKQFVCDKCGFRTHTARKLKSHQLVHTAEREQKRELSRLNNVARAEEKRINPRNFPCDFPMCNKVFNILYVLLPRLRLISFFCYDFLLQ